ncbi:MULTISPECIES: hypothetical protein [unclassified Streptomyces]|uniref:hypothetical protein n=1 Tax=unclassified Streptomyces TaxID=2593676 RepID=UPI002DDAADDB|nr:hypothetical protein [Streptomyces sp. NBC_01750]WSB03513.1 hypothetical protein OIE54_32085 [Streptomyces sp. NBC_01794]WSD32210.1 hypothetical protein OG966_10015 [Streptomyces sp. NBC_01750]
MTETPLTPALPVTDPAGPGRTRTVVCAVAIASCVPYLSLKTAWIAGSRIGIPDGSVLLEHRALMAVANSVTVLMDGAVIVLALLLTQAWGRRVPAWLPAVPLWIAGGLLLPIMVGFPVQLLTHAFTGAPSRRAGDKPFLDEWVFGVVYTGFIVQGLALGTLFVLYARERWSHVWRGRVWDLPTAATGRTLKVTAVTAAVLALFPATMRLLWACGATTGLSATRIEQRTADFYVLEGISALFVAVAVTGVLLIAFRRGRALPLRTPLAMAWLGSGAVGCWGVWLLIAAVLPGGEEGERASGLMALTYAVGVIVGLLVVTGTVSFLRRRGA